MKKIHQSTNKMNKFAILIKFSCCYLIIENHLLFIESFRLKTQHSLNSNTHTHTGKHHILEFLYR